MKRSIAYSTRFGAGLAAYAIVVHALSGGRSTERLGASIYGVIAWYLLAGLTSGLVIAVLRPWATSRLRGALLGAIISVPLSTGCYLLLPDRTFSLRQFVIFVLLAGIMLGVPAGALLWEPE